MHLSVIVSLCRRDGGRQLSPSCDQVLVDDSVCSFFIYIYIYNFRPPASPRTDRVSSLIGSTITQTW